MNIEFKILEVSLLEEFTSRIDFNPLVKINTKSEEILPFNYFQFYRSVSTVYSSKIEGENVDVDSYMKHKFLHVQYEPDYTKRADDLFGAYEFMESNFLNEENVLAAHKLLSQNLLASSQRGEIRKNPMFVMNEEDRIEYVACDPRFVKREWDKLFYDIKLLLETKLANKEVFFFAALIHLVFLKIHPLQDGNGRTARLIEKWFLREKLGNKVTAVELEKNYYRNKQNYYDNIRRIGLEYETLDYSKAIEFLLMTINSLNK